MKSFKASSWDSDADADDHSYREMFTESNRRNRDRPNLVMSSEEGKLGRLFKKQFRDFKSKNVNFITVQTKIELGKGQKKRVDFLTRNCEGPSKIENVRKKSNASDSDSEDSDDEATEKQKKLLKKYSSEISSLNSNSEKLSKELLREKKRQKKLKKLEKAKKKQMVRAIESKIVDNFEKVRAIESKIVDSLESEQPLVTKIKKEPVDKPKKPAPTRKEEVKKKPAKEKVVTSSDININIPESLRMAKKLKLQEKLKTILSQVQQQQQQQQQHKPIMTLRQKMMEKLKAARFRFLNEQIYTTDGKEAQRIFKSDPEAFIAYHEGYRQQVMSWPMNPLDLIIKIISKMPKTHVVADFGCGEARLAKSVPQKVHSFDLIAISPLVVACDMANVPLKDASIDVAVFCLSLMGTNIHDYIFEANRVLKIGGILKIAEVESRFGKAVDTFIQGIQYFGFKKIWKDLTHNMFYFLGFKKVTNVKNKKKLPTISLLPCLYKKR